MKWIAAFVLTACCLAGCHTPTPSFNLLAPYGSSRVAPPSTNLQGANGAYYNGTAPAVGNVPATQTTTPSAASQPTLKRSDTTSPYVAAEGAWKPVGSTTSASAAPVFQGTAVGSSPNGIQQVSYSGAESTTAASQTGSNPSNTDKANTGSTSSTLRLGGMPINDATHLAEPATFRPPAGATPLSAQSNSTVTADGIVVSTAKSSDNATPGGTTAKSTLQWNARYAPRLPGSTP